MGAWPRFIMTRLGALVLGILWILVLVGIDLGFLLRADSLREQLDSAIADTFVSKVTYGDFEGGWPGNLVLHDVAISEPRSERSQLVSLDRVVIEMDWSALLVGKSPVAAVRLVRPDLSLSWDSEGALHLPSPLQSDAEGGGEMPNIIVEGLRLNLVNSPYLLKPSTVIDLEEFQCSLIPVASAEDRYEFDVTLDDPNVGDLEASGSLSDDGVSMELVRRSYRLTPWLQDVLVDDVLDLLSQFEVEGDLLLRASLQPDPEDPGDSAFEGHVDLKGVAVKLQGTDLPVTNLRGRVRYSRGILEADDLTGELGGGLVYAKATVDFLSSPPKVTAGGTVEGLELTDELVQHIASFPEPGAEITEQLNEWRLRGPIDVVFNLSQTRGAFGGPPRLQPNLVVHLRNNSLVYDGFRYPLRNLIGDIKLDDEGLSFERLMASSGTMSLVARGNVNYAVEGQESWTALVKARGLTVDDALLAAIPKDVQNGIRSLGIEGQVDLQLSTAHRVGEEEHPPSITIDLKGLSVRPEEFPLRFEDLRGRVHLDEHEVLRAEAISARSGDMLINLNGNADLSGPDGDYLLDATVEGLRPDERLLSALEVLLPEAAREIRDLHLSGAVRTSELLLNGNFGDGSPDVDATFHLENISARPKVLPVQLDGITGQVSVISRLGYREVALLEGATARLGDVPFRVHGRYVPERGHLVKIQADRFPITPELLPKLMPLFPELSTTDGLPRLEGRGDRATVVIVDEGKGTKVNARVALSDLSVEPAQWRDVALQRASVNVIVEGGMVRLESLKAEVPRPSHLPPLPRVEGSPGSQSFQVRPVIHVDVQSCEFRNKGDVFELGLSKLDLKNIPLESWILGMLGMEKSERESTMPVAMSGVVNLFAESVSIGQERKLINGGTVDVRALHLGEGGAVFIDRARVQDLELMYLKDGRMTIGGDRTFLVAENMRVLNVNIPRIEGMVTGDEKSLALNELGGVIFGYENDGFDLKTATLAQLRQRVEKQGYLAADEAQLMSLEQLREIVAWREHLDIERANVTYLRKRVAELGIMSAGRARRLDRKKLLKLLRERPEDVGQPLGVLSGEATHFGINWDGRFWFDGYLDRVQIAQAIASLGGSAEGVHGRLKTWLSVEGNISDAESWTGAGTLQASVINAVRLPLFLNVLKALDISSWFQSSRRADVIMHFAVGQKMLRITEGRLTSSGLDLALVPPGWITFGGIINAAFDVRHKGGIPLVSDILDILPSLILSGVSVQGPLEDPTVTARSLGITPEASGTSSGRKPRLKEPDKH